MMTARMLVATRRKVVRKSARDWPRKSCVGREVNRGITYYGMGVKTAYNLAFVDVAGAVEEGVHCELRALWVVFIAVRF